MLKLNIYHVLRPVKGEGVTSVRSTGRFECVVTGYCVDHALTARCSGEPACDERGRLIENVIDQHRST